MLYEIRPIDENTRFTAEDRIYRTYCKDAIQALYAATLPALACC